MGCFGIWAGLSLVGGGFFRGQFSGFVVPSCPFGRGLVAAGAVLRGLAPLIPYWARAQPPFLVVRPKLRSRFRFNPAMRVWIQAWFFTTPM